MTEEIYYTIVDQWSYGILNIGPVLWFLEVFLYGQKDNGFSVVVMSKDIKEPKKLYCKICKRELLPRDSLEESSEKPKVSLHHIDYQKNIAIRVCKQCHNKLHTTMKKHKYGLNNVIRRDGSKKGRLSPGDYPEKIIN